MGRTSTHYGEEPFAAKYKDYLDCVSDLLANDLVRSMGKYPHHSAMNCLEHCVNVSYVSYRICRRLRLDARSAARGGLLHDFFLYDWHVTQLEQGLHGFHHAKLALQNATTHFDLNDMEKDIIRKHMWPLNITPPRYRESFVVVIADKYCTIIEVLKIGERKRISRLQRMLA